MENCILSLHSRFYISIRYVQWQQLNSCLKSPDIFLGIGLFSVKFWSGCTVVSFVKIVVFSTTSSHLLLSNTSYWFVLQIIKVDQNCAFVFFWDYCRRP